MHVAQASAIDEPPISAIDFDWRSRLHLSKSCESHKKGLGNGRPPKFTHGNLQWRINMHGPSWLLMRLRPCKMLMRIVDNIRTESCTKFIIDGWVARVPTVPENIGSGPKGTEIRFWLITFDWQCLCSSNLVGGWVGKAVKIRRTPRRSESFKKFVVTTYTFEPTIPRNRKSARWWGMIGSTTAAWHRVSFPRGQNISLQARNDAEGFHCNVCFLTEKTLLTTIILLHFLFFYMNEYTKSCIFIGLLFKYIFLIFLQCLALPRCTWHLTSSVYWHQLKYCPIWNMHLLTSALWRGRVIDLLNDPTRL